MKTKLKTIFRNENNVLIYIDYIKYIDHKGPNLLVLNFNNGSYLLTFHKKSYTFLVAKKWL